jgi:hypothetical protein
MCVVTWPRIETSLELAKEHGTLLLLGNLDDDLPSLRRPLILVSPPVTADPPSAHHTGPSFLQLPNFLTPYKTKQEGFKTKPNVVTLEVIVVSIFLDFFKLYRRSISM